MKPSNVSNAPLSDDLVIRYSGVNFVATSAPITLSRIFGSTSLQTTVGDGCSSVYSKRNASETYLAIHVQKCLNGLEPNTNYQLVVPASVWKHNSRESPSSAVFTFHTTNGLSWLLAFM